jgi:GTP-binding protein EngB required for normal cell division
MLKNQKNVKIFKQELKFEEKFKKNEIFFIFYLEIEKVQMTMIHNKFDRIAHQKDVAVRLATVR